MNIIILSGLSGSGKTSAMKVLEDKGFYCVDNLPTSFISQFIAFCERESNIKQLALAVDCRAYGSIDEFVSVIKEMKKDNRYIEVIFTEADPNVLVRRYSETRRPHPFGGGSLIEAIKNEMKVLKPIKEIADFTLDTTKTNVHELKKIVQKTVDVKDESNKLAIQLISFGFKNGVPLESDLMLDVRFLPNPFFVEELKNLTGLDKPVMKYLSGMKETKKLLKKYFALLNYLLHQYSLEGRSRLTISIGCTGGKHRSVYIVEKLKKHIRRRYPLLYVTHRDIESKFPTS